MTKLSVLFVSHKYPPNTGGMEKQSYELITRMCQYAKVYPLVYEGSESIIHFFTRLNRRILDLVRQHPEIRIVHFNDGLIASLALYHRGYDHLKKVVTVHGLDVVFPFGLYQRKILARFNRFDQIIAVSQATAHEIIARGVESHRVQVVANGIDHEWSNEKTLGKLDALLQKHQIPLGKQYLVLLGRPVKRKGFSWFIKEVLPHLDPKYYVLLIGPFMPKICSRERLFSIIPARWRHLLMLFLGHPSDLRVLRTLLQHPIYRTRVSHLGKIPADDLQVVLSEATAFMMPNISVPGDMEGFGLVCLEASSKGAIVFAAELEGITDAIQHEKNGFLVKSGNSAAWIKSLERLDDNTQDILSLREQFRNYTLEQFSWDKMTKGYFDIFCSVLEAVYTKNS